MVSWQSRLIGTTRLRLGPSQRENTAARIVLSVSGATWISGLSQDALYISTLAMQSCLQSVSSGPSKPSSKKPVSVNSLTEWRLHSAFTKQIWRLCRFTKALLSSSSKSWARTTTRTPLNHWKKSSKDSSRQHLLWVIHSERQSCK